MAHKWTQLLTQRGCLAWKRQLCCHWLLYIFYYWGDITVIIIPCDIDSLPPFSWCHSILSKLNFSCECSWPTYALNDCYICVANKLYCNLPSQAASPLFGWWRLCSHTCCWWIPGCYRSHPEELRSHLPSQRAWVDSSPSLQPLIKKRKTSQGVIRSVSETTGPKTCPCEELRRQLVPTSWKDYITWNMMLSVVSLSRAVEFFTRIVPSDSMEKGADSGRIRRAPTNPPCGRFTTWRNKTSSAVCHSGESSSSLLCYSDRPLVTMLAC